MESDSDSMASLREKDSTALSSGNDSALNSYKNQQPVLSPASAIQNEQSNDVVRDQINEPLNEADERFLITFSDDYLAQIKGLNALIQKLRGENEDSKVKQAVSDEKDKRSGLYEDLIGELREKCSVKDEQLVERARLIELLEAKCIENEGTLQSKINEIQTKCGKKEEQLIKKDKLLADNKNLIEKLQAENNEKTVQLKSKSAEIDKLQEACNNKDLELAEKVTLVEKLQADCDEKDKQAKAALDRLKDLGNCMHDSSKLVSALWKCGLESSKQKQYDEELVYWQIAIELEKATQNRSRNLAILFRNKASYFNRLRQYQQAVEAATSSLQYDPNNKEALNSRGVAYEYLKQYSNACQDYKKALQLDPSYEFARNNLKEVQERINASNSQ